MHHLRKPARLLHMRGTVLYTPRGSPRKNLNMHTIIPSFYFRPQVGRQVIDEKRAKGTYRKTKQIALANC